MPDVVAELSPAERASRVVFSDDRCVLDDEHFFILGNLDIPVHGQSEPIPWTVWTSLSRANFERSVQLWNTQGRETEPAYFGWLSNAIPGCATVGHIGLHVHTGPVGERPRLIVLDECHPLGAEQRTGVSAERADEFIDLAAHGAASHGARTAARRIPLLGMKAGWLSGGGFLLVAVGAFLPWGTIDLRKAAEGGDANDLGKAFAALFGQIAGGPVTVTAWNGRIEVGTAHVPLWVALAAATVAAYSAFDRQRTPGFLSPLGWLVALATSITFFVQLGEAGTAETGLWLALAGAALGLLAAVAGRGAPAGSATS